MLVVHFIDGSGRPLCREAARWPNTHHFVARDMVTCQACTALLADHPEEPWEQRLGPPSQAA